MTLTKTRPTHVIVKERKKGSLDTLRMRKSYRKQVLKNLSGKVVFDKKKTPLEIQKQMRDEWR